MIRIAVVDDNKKTLDHIQAAIHLLLKKMTAEFVISTFTSGKDLMKHMAIQENPFDVVFLDLEMPNEFGMEIAKTVRNNDKDIQIVFVTSHDNYVFESFQYEAAAYIRKKEFNNEIEQVLVRICDKVLLKNKELFFNNANGAYRIKVKDIMYFESKDHCITIHTINNKELQVTATLSSIEQNLSNNQFLRPYSSYLVNSLFIYSIENNNILLTDGTKIPVSRCRVKEIKEAFQRNMRLI